MTRVTRTMPKLSSGVAFRSISSSVKSSFLSNELKLECQKGQLKSAGSKAELINRLDAHNYTTTALRRPTPGSQSQAVFRPLMQTFKTSAPAQAARDHSTIDYFFLPEMPIERGNNMSFTLRVPLLPDNFSADHSFRAPEILDTAVPPAEILIVAANPESTVAAAMTEVVGNAGLEENVEVLSRAAAYQPWKPSQETSSHQEKGILSELWNGVLDDVFGAKKTSSPVLA